jgi:hypothetical protein
MRKKIMDQTFKVFICAFILLNFITIINSNRPQWLLVERILPSNTTINDFMNQFRWRISMYAHYAGLDNRWEMFSFIYREDWFLVFKARYEGEEQDVYLPLALQSERRFIDKWFYDFREAKYRLNIYGSKGARQHYAKWLCEKYNMKDNHPILYVAVDYETTDILPREQARELGHHLGDKKITKRFDLVPCNES